LSRKGTAVTDGISSKCAALDVYDVLTNAISRVRLPECMHDRLVVHANSNYLVVGHRARVYVFKKSSDGTFYQEDELKLTYNENVSAGLWSGVTGGHVNFGYRVYVSPTDDIYTFQPHETTFNDIDGALHRFQRREQSAPSPSQEEVTSPFYETVFPTCTLIGDARPTTLVPFGDYDGNGLLDIIELSQDKTKISVRLQTSARTFASETTILISELSGEKVLRPESVGDFTNDGKEDIVLLGGGTTWGKNRGSSDVFYASNPSSWLPWTVSEQSNTKWGNRMATGDFNDDGWLDIVTNNIWFSDLNDVYINTKAVASIGVQVKSLANTGTFSHDVVVGDMDGDSNLDAIFVSSDSGGDYVVYGDGNGNFGDKWRFDGGSRGAIAVCDFDGDGRLDVATGDYYSALKVHYTAGASSYSRTSLFSRSSTISEASNYIYGLACADVNHDGWADLIVSGAKVSVFINQGYKGESNFIVKDGQQIIFDQKPTWGGDHLTLKDMDGDGSLDLVTPWHICWNNAGN